MSSSADNQTMLQAYFHYIPQEGLTVTALCFFSNLIILSAYAAFKSKYPLSYIVTITAAAEFVGFVFRLLCETNADLANYLTTTLLILMAPNLLALYNYVMVGRIIDIQTKAQQQRQNQNSSTTTTASSDITQQIQRNQEKKSKFTIPVIQDKATGLYNANRISYFFLFSDIASFGLQGIAGGMMASPSSANLGISVFQFSLAIQLGFFVTFFYVTYQAYSLNYYRESPGISKENQYILFHVLFLTTALLTVRNIYRFAEFSEGNDGFMTRHEPFFYTFDTALIILCIALYTAYPVGDYLSSSSNSKTKMVSSNNVSKGIAVKTVGEKKTYTKIGGSVEQFIELDEMA